MFNPRTITESEWLAEGEPGHLTEAVVARGWVSDRKLRLWACACCRRIWYLLVDERSRIAVEVAERFADGEATKAELIAACESGTAGLTFEATPEVPESAGWQEAAYAASNASAVRLADDQYELIYCTTTAVSAVAAAKDPWLSEHWDTTRDYQDRYEKFTEAVEAAEKREQARLVREIVGNPFRTASAEAAWLTPSVVALARTAYEERTLPSGELDLACLAIFADALEDAGCTNPYILEHLRSQGPHVRGCWPVDLVLGLN
jgi:hypothetical protein